MRSTVQTVTDWLAAVNAGDVEGAVACSHPEVAVHGPRGSGHGHDLMRGWLQRSGIRLEPEHELQVAPAGGGQGERLVVRATARWTADNVPFGAPAEPMQTWCVFEVQDAVITSISRYERADAVPEM